MIILIFRIVFQILPRFNNGLNIPQILHCYYQVNWCTLSATVYGFGIQYSAGHKFVLQFYQGNKDTTMDNK